MSQSEQNSSLPFVEEIQLNILSFLDPLSLLNAACVSRDMYHITSDKTLWGPFLKTYKASSTTNPKEDVLKAMKYCNFALLIELPIEIKTVLITHRDDPLILY